MQNRLTKFWHVPPTAAAICDRDITARLKSRILVTAAVLVEQTIALAVGADELDFIHAECRRLRGTVQGVPFVARLTAFDGFMRLGKPTVYHALYEVVGER